MFKIKYQSKMSHVHTLSRFRQRPVWPNFSVLLHTYFLKIFYFSFNLSSEIYYMIYLTSSRSWLMVIEIFAKEYIYLCTYTYNIHIQIRKIQKIAIAKKSEKLNLPLYLFITRAKKSFPSNILRYMGPV